MVLAGIDLAWNGNTSPSGLAIGKLENYSLTVTNLYLIYSYDAIIEVLNNNQNISGIAIDAPLIIKNKIGLRECERLIGKEYGSKGSSCYPSNLTLFDHPRGMLLSKWLEEKSFIHLGVSGKWQIECYPHPALIEIFYLDYRLPYKKGNVQKRRDGQIVLAGFVRSLEVNSRLRLVIPPEYSKYLNHEFINQLKGTRLKENEDRLDSLLCLYISGLYSINCSHRIFGNTDDGYIYVPLAK